MNVKELIEILEGEVKECDRGNAQIEIWEGEQEYEIESMSGFSISANVVFNIKKTFLPSMRPAVLKKKYHRKAKKILDDISKN